MTYDLVADYLNVIAVLDDPNTQVSDATRKMLIEFQRFVQARAYILASRPEQSFAQAANMPDSTKPASKAMARWFSGKETRPWLKWSNKPQKPSPCIMTLAGTLSRSYMSGLVCISLTFVLAALWQGTPWRCIDASFHPCQGPIVSSPARTILH